MIPHRRNRVSRRSVSERGKQDGGPDRSLSNKQAARRAQHTPAGAPTLRLPGRALLLTALALLGPAAGMLLAQPAPLPASDAGASPVNLLLHPHAPADSATLFVALLIVLVLIFANAFLALAEIALITIRKTRIRQLVEEGNRSAMLIERLLAQPTRLMATIQTGITLIATFSSTIAATTAVGPVGVWLRAEGMAERPSRTLALILVALPVAVCTLVIGEIAPKSLAVRSPEKFALIAVYPVHGLQVLLTPIVAVLTFLSNVVVRPFGGTAHFTTPAVNEEELKILVEAGEEQGMLEPEETEMIHSILDFGDIVARKVMTPRIDLTAMEITSPMPELIRLVEHSGHSRIPVYEGDLDNIVGIVHAKDLLALPPDGTRDDVPIRGVMRPPYFIPETKKVDELLREFRRSKQQLAIVRDEYGVTSGLVTIEDLLEQIVGDIQDEYDQDEPKVQVIDASTTIWDGRMGLNEVNDRMGTQIPEEDADTIGGFVFGLLGHQAVQGESIRWFNLDFTVEATDGRRITKVRLVHRRDSDDEPPQFGVSQRAYRSPAESARYPVETSGVETAP